MNTNVSALINAVATSQPDMRWALYLGFCEHFVYSAEHLFSSIRFEGILGELWEWRLQIRDVEPQSSIASLMQSLPVVDPDAPADIRADVVVSTGVLLEQTYKALSGDAGGERNVLFVVLDLVSLYAGMLEDGAALEKAQSSAEGDEFDLEFCREYLIRAASMVKELSVNGMSDILEWRLDQRRWGQALRDRVAEALGGQE